MPDPASRQAVPARTFISNVPYRHLFINTRLALDAGQAMGDPGQPAKIIGNISNPITVSYPVAGGPPWVPDIPAMPASNVKMGAATQLILSCQMPQTFLVEVELRAEPDAVLISPAPIWITSGAMGANALYVIEGRRVPADTFLVKVTNTAGAASTGWLYVAVEAP